MYESFGLFIDGKWVKAADGATAEIMSPVTERPIGTTPVASAKDTAAAIIAAKRGMAALAGWTAFERADALHRVADEITRRKDEIIKMVSTETGKPLAQSEREWGLSLDQFRWYAEEARRIYGRTIESRAPGARYEVTKVPVGIVAAFTAWNFPAVLPSRKLAPALAAGCSVILRPSSQTPGSAMVIVDCIRAAGFPDGTVGLLNGSTKNIYDPIMAERAIRKVSLTGSTRVGKQMIRDAADTVKKVSMELGGNAPIIIHDDVDVDAFLDVAVPVKYANAGQVCVSPDRWFVHESLHDKFVDGFASRAAALKLGDGLDPDTAMGPMINAGALESTESVIADAEKSGAKIRTGGKRPADFNAGHFIEPTVLSEVTDDMRVFAEENFGPIAAITRFKGDDEVIERANASDMGLAAYCFTKNPARARRAVAEIHSGMVGINSFALASSEAPFGGTNQSGLGREGGLEGIEDYLDLKLAQIVM